MMFSVLSWIVDGACPTVLFSLAAFPTAHTLATRETHSSGLLARIQKAYSDGGSLALVLEQFHQLQLHLGTIQTQMAQLQLKLEALYDQQDVLRV